MCKATVSDVTRLTTVNTLTWPPDCAATGLVEPVFVNITFASCAWYVLLNFSLMRSWRKNKYVKFSTLTLGYSKNILFQIKNTSVLQHLSVFLLNIHICCILNKACMSSHPETRQEGYLGCSWSGEGHVMEKDDQVSGLAFVIFLHS